MCTIDITVRIETIKTDRELKQVANINALQKEETVKLGELQLRVLS